ncbi:filamentous hemagglutinin N-terminal domain-containing protein [Cupriavidus sp. TMH.W2]|uniref:two-partner secretion domain-containing protein n=1 Tax=Cupriavidus sp. TMH.W2 TaxID=3434465 RepID=UPI003D77E3FA
MNHGYRLVWSAAQAACVPAPENVRAKGKQAGGKALSRTGGLCAALLLGSPVFAAPAGGVISSGAGSIATAGASTTITQDNGKLAINWNSFSIASGETVNFVQPGSSAVALNRVVGSSASEIYGKLNANGQVFLLNPNGILFGRSASVNVGGLVASTLNLPDSDFLAGRYRFAGNAGSVVNQGSITAADGGYIAMLGGRVSNQGTLVARLGTVALAAGRDITLDFAGDGLLSVTVSQGTLDALAENRQLIRADGGSAVLTAAAADRLAQAVVNNDGVIEARTVDNRSGTIRLLGDMERGMAKVGGTLDASAPGSGNGGFIETSGAQVAVADGARITTAAAGGRTGTWLVDPGDFTIGSGNAALTTSGIGAATLSASLASNSVVLATANTGSGNGDISVNAPVSWSANTTLTLNAYRNLNVNAPMTAAGNSAGLALNYGNYVVAGTASSGTGYSISAPVTLSGASASLRINGDSYTLLHSMADLAAINSNGLAGKYALAQDLDAAGMTYAAAVVGSGSSPLTGTFAGLGHTVSNLTINANGNNVGLFGQSSPGAVVRDIGLVNAVVSGQINVGLLVGNNLGDITNAYVAGGTASSQHGYSVGGIAGNNDGLIRGAYSTADVTGGPSAGGLAGSNHGRIGNAYATGSVTGNNTYQVGGLVGYSSGSIDNAYATGTVAAPGGSRHVGGLLGINVGTVSNAYATGNVIGSAGSYRMGGLVGTNAGSITNTYATGTVTGDSAIGGLAGRNEGRIAASFWLLGNTGTGIGDGILQGATGLASAQANSLSTYAASGWSIDATGGTNAVWRIYDGYTMPLLRSFLKPVTVTVAAGKTYDGTTGGIAGYTLSDASASLSGSLGFASNSSNAGNYSTAAGSLAISGLYSSQQAYDIVYAGNLHIDKAPLIVSGAAAAGKTYDGTAVATVTGGSLAGVVAGDTVTLSQSGTFSDKNAGAGKSVVMSFGIGGGDAANYWLVNPTATATADIGKAPLTIIATDDSRAMDGRPYTGGNGIRVSGLLAGDTASVLYGSQRYGGSAQGAVQPGVYAIAPAGLHADNYTIAYVDGSLVIRNAAPPSPRYVAAIASAANAGRPEPALPAAAPDLLAIVDGGLRLQQDSPR